MINIRVRLVVRVGVINSSINNGNIVAAAFVEVREKGLSIFIRPANGVILKIAVLVHIVDISPDIFQWDPEFLKSRDDVCKLAPALVAPAALVVSKGKVLLHGGEADGAGLVGLADFDLAWTGVEVQVDAAAERPPCNIVGSQKDFLAVGIAQEYTV